jgi:hypothetical protein
MLISNNYKLKLELQEYGRIYFLLGLPLFFNKTSDKGRTWPAWNCGGKGGYVGGRDRGEIWHNVSTCEYMNNKKKFKNKNGGGDFMYDTFDTLLEPLQMPQCIPIQDTNKWKKIKKWK